jgi:hypothetical protein
MVQEGNPPRLNLAITLRHLAAGDSYRSLMYSFTVSHNTIPGIVCDVCEAIIAEYAEEVMPIPTTQEEGQQIADKFRSNWQFTMPLVLRMASTYRSGVHIMVSPSTSTTRATIPLCCWHW